MKAMIKKYKWGILISSIVTLLPMLFGLIVYKMLPEQIAIHWGVSGEADGYAHPLFAIIFLPVFFVIMNFLCIWTTTLDANNKDQSPKIFGMIFWIMPCLSLFTNGMVYAAAFGAAIHTLTILPAILGILMILMGNYMPKCKYNRTIGIKTPWALANEESWNATHRFGGKVQVIAGILLIVSAFLPEIIMYFALFVLVFGMVIVVTLYSYFYFKKQLKEGRAKKEDAALRKGEKIATIILLITIPLLVVFLIFITMTGNIEANVSENTLTVKADFYEDLNIDLSKIDTVELRGDGVDGRRIMGFGSTRLLLGTFTNDEFGNHIRYTYTKPEPCVVITCGNSVYVIGLETEEKTTELYTLLSEYVKEQK